MKNILLISLFYLDYHYNIYGYDNLFTAKMVVQLNGCNIISNTQKCYPIFAATTLSQCHNNVVAVIIDKNNAAV